MAGSGWNKPVRCIDFVKDRGASLIELLDAVDAVCCGDQFGPLAQENISALHRAYINLSEAK